MRGTGSGSGFGVGRQRWGPGLGDPEPITSGMQNSQRHVNAHGHMCFAALTLTLARAHSVYLIE
eukprot:7389477-Prymnesium_polylepis.1